LIIQGLAAGVRTERFARLAPVMSHVMVRKKTEGRQDWQGLDAAAALPAPEPATFGSSEDSYTSEHEQVLNALAQAQETHQGEAVYLDEVAAASGLPRERAGELLHELATVYRLVTQIQETDAPGPGPRYEVKPRL
jgi:hypothetical protein